MESPLLLGDTPFESPLEEVTFEGDITLSSSSSKLGQLAAGSLVLLRRSFKAFRARFLKCSGKA